MKTPTLIVRLASLFLAAYSAIGLHEVNYVKSLAHSGGPTPQNGFLGNLTIYLVLGLVVGVVGAAFAGPLARLLTFDSEPRVKSPDLAEQLLTRNKPGA